MKRVLSVAGVADAIHTLQEKEKDVASPHARSRNALKIILDLDENFGRVPLAGDQAWKKIPGILGGKTQS